MAIIPKTLKALREKSRLSQQGLADRTTQIKGSSVSKRTIARYESGEFAPEKVRPHTVESLAKALGVAPEALGKPVSETDSATLEEAGYRRVSVWLSKEVRQNYRWTTHHYDVSVQDLVNAAPWMFTLLAEKSLAERARRLKTFKEAFEGAMAVLPAHLAHGAAAYTDFEQAVGDEKTSLASRDLFGEKLLESKSVALDPFDPEETNPFVEFLNEMAAQIGSDAIRSKDLRHTGHMPEWPLFEEWLDDLTGGDPWARFAVENVKGVLDAMPRHLKGVESTAERVQWLIDRISSEMRVREDERQARSVEVEL